MVIRPETQAQNRCARLRIVAERLGHDELRISHEQNIVLPHVAQADLPEIYRTLKSIGLATANVGLISDIIACPGMDYCALATARSIPIAQDIALRYADREAEIGHMQIKISGCINACGHHHVGHVGILGLDQAGVENYQITVGGSAGNDAAIGEKMGRGFSVDELMPALDRLIDAYLALRLSEEGNLCRCCKASRHGAVSGGAACRRSGSLVRSS